MKRLLAYLFIVLGLGLNFNAYAAPVGKGQIQLSEDVVKSFIDYIAGDIGTQKSLFNKPGTFWITIDGSRSYSWYNPHGEGVNTIKLLDETKKFWKKNKITGNVISSPSEEKVKCERHHGQSCSRFARGRYVRWDNGINPKGKAAKFSSKMSESEVRAKLTKLGFYNNDFLDTTTTPKITKKKETTKTQIAKAEPSQTKKITKEIKISNQDWRKKFELIQNKNKLIKKQNVTKKNINEVYFCKKRENFPGMEPVFLSSYYKNKFVGCDNHIQISENQYINEILSYRMYAASSMFNSSFFKLSTARNIVKEFNELDLNTKYLLKVLQSEYGYYKAQLKQNNQIAKAEPSQTQNKKLNNLKLLNSEFRIFLIDKDNTRIKLLDSYDGPVGRSVSVGIADKHCKILNSKNIAVGLSYKKDFINNGIIREYKCQSLETQIAKAEPSQKQKVAKKYCLFIKPDGTTKYRGHDQMTFEATNECPIPQAGYGKWVEISFEDYKKYNPKFYPDENKIVKKEKIITPKKKVKVAKKEPKQEEFKPKKTNQDNEAPIIEIAEVITVDDTDYEFQGKVTDQAKTIYVEVDGRPTDVKNGKFIVKGYSPIDKQISIEAIDQWGNRSEPKIVKLTIDIKDTSIAERLEPLNPSKIRSKSSNNKVALIIGIENYLESPNAKYANLDAKYFFDYARKGFGVKKQNINLLVDEDATFVKTNKALTKWLRSKIKSGQSDLIIFFAGHGLASSDGKELYLLPQDSDPDLLARTALSRTELFQEIINLNPKSVTMFLDTCYSGVSRDEQMLLASARPIRIVADEQSEIPNNFTIFSASKLDQISSGLKEANHGIFSYYLMKGLEGNADSNEDKKITNGELLAYMDLNVSQKASELGRQQNPSLSGDPDKVLMSYR